MMISRAVDDTLTPSANSNIARARLANPAATLGRRNMASNSFRCRTLTVTVRCLLMGTSLFQKNLVRALSELIQGNLFPYLGGGVLSHCLSLLFVLPITTINVINMTTTMPWFNNEVCNQPCSTSTRPSR